MPIEKKCSLNYGRQIVILQRGWIFVGKMTRIGNECELTEAATIRNWGTTKGLGEIAENGPTPNTKLDPCPMVRFHYLTVVGVIECNEKNWSK
jgi:hypothetical protein